MRPTQSKIYINENNINRIRMKKQLTWEKYSKLTSIPRSTLNQMMLSNSQFDKRKKSECLKQSVSVMSHALNMTPYEIYDINSSEVFELCHVHSDHSINNTIDNVENRLYIQSIMDYLNRVSEQIGYKHNLKELFISYYIQGNSLQDIANEWGTSRNNVFIKLSRCRDYILKFKSDESI